MNTPSDNFAVSAKNESSCSLYLRRGAVSLRCLLTLQLAISLPACWISHHITAANRQWAREAEVSRDLERAGIYVMKRPSRNLIVRLFCREKKDRVWSVSIPNVDALRLSPWWLLHLLKSCDEIKNVTGHGHCKIYREDGREPIETAVIARELPNTIVLFDRSG